MSDPPNRNTNEAAENSAVPSLRDNIGRAFLLQIEENRRQNRTRRNECIQLRTTPYVFPTLGDLPNLLVNIPGTIFHNAQLDLLRCHQGEIRRIHDDQTQPTEVLEETWSQFIERIGEPQKSTSDVNQVCPSTLLCLRRRFGPPISPSVGSPSTKSILGQDEAAFLEKQILSSELDAFITAHQQEHNKEFEKYDEDETIRSEERQACLRSKIRVTLFLLMFIFCVNLGAALFLIHLHNDEIKNLSGE